MGQVEAAGFPTLVRHFGEGPRAALMIHCTLGQSALWQPLAERLGDLLSMTAFDLPGHGGSGAWQGPGDVQALAVRMAADLLGTGPADVIGHSFGGTVALRLAAERPELVRSLTLIEPVFFQVLAKDRPELMAEHDLQMQPYADAVARGDWREAARLFTAVWGDGRPWDSLPDEQRSTMARRMPVVEAASEAILADAGAVLASGALERMACPTLIVEGAESPRYIGAVCERLAARIPAARRAVIAGAGHMVPLTHPDAVARELRDFLGAGAAPAA
ncbi:MAG: alpha/beta fold hydrolase [Paracoccaceae bacterium]